MCEYCSELFTGDCGEDLIETTIGIGTCEDAMMIQTFLGDDGDKEAYICTMSFINDNEVSYDKIAINYCPICGRKLKEGLENV